MYDRAKILDTLKSENYFIDQNSLNLFLDDWKIDSIYENENGLELYDDISLQKIRKGISLKAQGYSDEQIVAKLSRIEPNLSKNSEEVVKFIAEETAESEEKPEETAPLVLNEQTEVPPLPAEPDRSFTLDVSSSTLQMLAEAVAKKISDDIKNSDMANQLIEAGGYKRDNEILAKQVKELLDHNRELSLRIEQLESHASKSFWAKFRGRG